MVRLWVIVSVVGCGYAPDSFRGGFGFPGARETVGCLDVSVHAQVDVLSHEPVLEMNFGNRCDHGVDVDFGAVRVRGRGDAGEVQLALHDPRREIRVRRMDGKLVGRELFEVRTRGAQLAELCVDITRLDRAARSAERWTCTPVVL